jgi:hypothetical protein
MWITLAVCATVALASCMMAQQPPPAATAPILQGGGDPNFPPPSSDALTGPLKVRWHYVRGADYPNIAVNDPRFGRQTGTAEYFGYDPGTGRSLFTRADNGQVLGYTLRTDTLEVAYNEKGEIPLAVLDRLRGGSVDYLITAKGGKPRNQQPEQPRELTPVELAQRQRAQDAASRQASGGVSQQDAAQAIAMLGRGKGTTPVPAPSGMITGTGADMRGGVLLFLRPDKTRASYKVVRPKIMQTASPSAGDITGTWIAMEDSGDGIMFTDGPDKSVRGNEIPAQALKMLMQPPQ